MLLFRSKFSSQKLTILILTICYILSSVKGLRKHKRQCCKYSFDNDSDVSNKLCENSSACIVEHLNNLTSPSLDSCRVLGDSKRDISTVESRQKCLEQNFFDDESSTDTEARNMSEMFELRRYIMESDGGPEFESIEVVLPAARDWYAVRFRITNMDLCPDDDGLSESCAPRCVDIEKRESKKDGPSNKNIVYDCEGGFYVSDSQPKAVRSTNEDSYMFDICFDSITEGKLCRTYLFELGGQTEDVILVEKSSLVDMKQIVLHMTDRMRRYLLAENGTSKLEIYRISDFQNPRNGNNELVQYFDMAEGDENSVYMLNNLPDGDYVISILAQESERISVAKFQLRSNELENSDTLSVGMISFITILAISAVFLLVLYRRYRYVQQNHQVCPHRLLESGRIKPKDVFIVTNVDNRHHINIVMDFGKYLKSHCAVGEVYFALDPETGITTQANHDPWKWAQSVADKMAENGCLIFIGAPPEHVGISIYKDLPNNQAFISTMHLKKMSDENRVAVVLFPYSDPETLPNLIPPHLKAKPYHLPLDMNSFLCQLLEVKKREIFTCIPVPIVPPEILPQNLNQFKGGKELLDNINSLTSKVELLKAELAHEKSGHGGTGSTLSRMIDDLEIKQLLRPDSKKKIPTQKNTLSNGSGLKIELESNLYSIKNSDFERRDKDVHPEFENV